MLQSYSSCESLTNPTRQCHDFLSSLLLLPRLLLLRPHRHPCLHRHPRRHPWLTICLCRELELGLYPSQRTSSKTIPWKSYLPLSGLPVLACRELLPPCFDCLAQEPS